MGYPLWRTWVAIAALAALLIKITLFDDTGGCFTDRNIDTNALSFQVVGTLERTRFYPSKYEKHFQEYYKLELDDPVCLHGAWSGSKLRNIRSVHVYARDYDRHVLLEKYNGMRVAVEFSWVYEQGAPDHRHPMVGAINDISPLIREESKG